MIRWNGKSIWKELNDSLPNITSNEKNFIRTISQPWKIHPLDYYYTFYQSLNLSTYQLVYFDANVIINSGYNYAFLYQCELKFKILHNKKKVIYLQNTLFLHWFFIVIWFSWFVMDKPVQLRTDECAIVNKILSIAYGW